MISSNLKLHKILLVLLFVGSLYSQELTRRVWIDSLFYNDGTNTYVHYNFAEDTLVTNYKGTAHRVLYIDASGDVTELAYGSSGQVLKSNGATSAPSWQADVSGAGGSSYADSIVHDTRHVIGDSLITDDEGAARYEPIDAAIVKSDEAETLTANWVNTAYPWADNEVASMAAIVADTTEYKTETRNFTIAYPDSLMDDIRIAEFPATLYPNGVTLTYLSISASASCTDTHIFEEWSDMIGTSQSTVHSLAISGAVRAETSSPTDDEIAAGGYLNLNMDDSTDDLDLILVTYRFYPTP